MKSFLCNNGQLVDLDWDEDQEEMTAWTSDSPRQKIGNVSFRMIEGCDPHGNQDCYKVVNMHLEGPNGTRAFLRQGIGREIVKYVGSFLPVIFSSNDGQPRSDGSHLTGDGSAFAEKMVDEGLAHWE